jgi:branched-chain amino acid transport system substrate-binding protein
MKKILTLFVVLFTSFMLVACADDPVELDRLTVTPPTTVEYVVGEEFDAAGMVVTAYYTDGTDKVLTASEYTLTGFSATAAGLVTITVTYEGETATFGVAVFDPEAPEVAQSLKVLSLPTQQIFGLSDELDAEGLSVEVTYSTGRKVTLEDTDYTLSGFLPGVIGDYNVVVTFDGVQTTFPAKVQAKLVQGVTDTTIKVGNTAVLAGPLAFVGLPFSYGMRAAFEEFNEAGGVNGRTIEYVNKDDGFDGTQGLINTRALIQEDQVFALVGHFGTPTINSTLGLIRETGIPMVYAATGANVLYSEYAPLDPVMPVQPIYLTDGRIMTARAVKEAVYGTNGDQALPANAKIGVLYTTSDDGISIKAGVDAESRTLGMKDNFIYASFSAAGTAELTAALENFRTQGVSAVIVASNQTSFKAAIETMNSISLSVPVFTSYVNADPTAVNPLTDYDFDIFTNAWVDVTSTEGAASAAEYVAAIGAASFLSPEEQIAMYTNAYATAGYIAAKVFLEGIERVGTGELTWETLTKALESAPIDIPMGSQVDFGNGMRHGIASMALLKYSVALGDNPLTTDVVETDFRIATFVKEFDTQSLEEIRE